MGKDKDDPLKNVTEEAEISATNLHGFFALSCRFIADF